jgi:hypothetical protein
MRGNPEGCGRGMWLGFEMYLGDALCGIPMGTHNVYYVKPDAMLEMFMSLVRY